MSVSENIIKFDNYSKITCKWIINNFNKEAFFKIYQSKDYNVGVKNLPKWKLTLTIEHNAIGSIIYKLKIKFDEAKFNDFYQWEAFVIDKNLQEISMDMCKRNKSTKKINIDNNNNYLQNNGSLIFTCDITLQSNKNFDFINNKPMLSNSVEKYSDVVLKFNDNRVIHAHKSILSEKSAVLKKLFVDNNANKIIEVVDISYNEMELIMEHIYTGKINDFDINIARSIISSVKKLKYDNLEKYCELYLIDNINIDNCVELLILSDLSNLKNLFKNTFNYVNDNFYNLKLCNFNNLFNTDNKKILFDILKNIYLNSKKC